MDNSNAKHWREASLWQSRGFGINCCLAAGRKRRRIGIQKTFRSRGCLYDEPDSANARRCDGRRVAAHCWRRRNSSSKHVSGNRTFDKIDPTLNGLDAVKASSHDSAMSDSATKERGSAILLLLLPTVGYSVVFLYQMGFCAFFRIPFNFIVLDVQSGLLVTLSLLFVLALVWQGVPDLFLFRKMTDAQFQRARGFMTLYAMAAPAIAVRFSIGIYTLYLGLFVMLTYIFMGRSKVGEEPKAEPLVGNFSALTRAFGKARHIDAILAFIIGGLLYSTGYWRASEVARFNVSGNWAIVTKFGDTLIERPFIVDPVTKTASLGATLRVEKLSDRAPLDFELSPYVVETGAVLFWAPEPR
jgi:hypothetical protein